MAKIKAMINSLQRDRFIYWSCIYLICLCYIFAKANNKNVAMHIFIYLKSFCYAGILYFTLYVVVYYFVLLYRHERQPLKAYWIKACSVAKMKHEIANFLLLVFVISIVFSCYTSVKSMIPTIVPFYLDPQLVELDRLIHFGLYPWQITHSFFTSPTSTAVINFFYNLWFFIWWVFLITYMLLLNRPLERERVLLCFCFAWMLNGCLLATGLSSAGPAFYEAVYPGSQIFSPLVERLNTQNNILIESDTWLKVWALNIQDGLWHSYATNQVGSGSGISAMPSMHVSISVLMALSLQRLSRLLGIIGWFYVLIIQVGSVHLAWHYAVDGYFSILSTALIWFVVGWWQSKVYQPVLTSNEMNVVEATH